MLIGQNIPHALTPDTRVDSTRERADLRKAAEGFESLFLTTLLKGARAASLGDDLTGSKAVDSARDMLDTELARVGGGRAGFGIAEAVERQFAPAEKAR